MNKSKAPRAGTGRVFQWCYLLLLAGFTFLTLFSCAPGMGGGGKGNPQVAAEFPAAAVLQRGVGKVEAAQELRRKEGASPAMGGVFSWPGDRERFYEYYRLAELDFLAILEDVPDSPFAAEAQYMLGLIHDNGHRNDFMRALEEYRKTGERYPGTAAAEKAGEKSAVIERYLQGVGGTPHGAP